MKTIIKTCLLLIAISSTLNIRLRIKDLPMTPKAQDLIDHFGTEPAKSFYGPKPAVIGKIAREGITGEGTPINPISNFNQEIKPTQVVAGELDNTSFDASKIIKPEIAVPKFDIKTTVVHEAVVKTPVRLGTQFEEKSQQSMNRVTGQVSRKTVTVEKPIIGIMNNVREVETNHETLVNVQTGKIIDPTKKAELHGLGF
jgi:hypothetical protein